MSEYTLQVHVDADPDEAEQRIRQALAEEGFGILTEIDVKATLKAKLDHDMPAYRILGACSPALARQAIEADPDIGALLPCNVVIRADADGATTVAAADPATMLAVSPKADVLGELAADARQRIQRALDAVGAR